MPVILHNNPSQKESCLVGLVQYAQRIATKHGDGYARLGSFPAVVKHIRLCPFEADKGTARRGVTTCSPIQRARIWPETFNCFEATAHGLGAFLYWRLLVENLDFHIFDRNLGPRTRHVWPVVFDRKTARAWIIVLDSVIPRRYRQMLANDWYNSALGVVHKTGRTVLKIYGLDAVGEAGEKAWGSQLPGWAREVTPGTPHVFNKPRKSLR